MIHTSKKINKYYMNCVFRILLMLFFVCIFFFLFQFSCSCCRFLLLRLETDSYVALCDCLLFVAYDTHRIVWFKWASITCSFLFLSLLFVFNSRNNHTCVCAPFSLITTMWHSKKEIVIKIHYSFGNILIIWPRM